MKLIFNAKTQNIQNVNIEGVLKSLELSFEDKTTLRNFENAISSLSEIQKKELNEIITSKDKSSHKLKDFFMKNGIQIGTTLFNGLIELLK